jgi:predicted Zn finger-like uncharacterized protein
MIIILPVGHEKMEAQRFPYVTLGIIILNVFIFVTTHYGIAPKSQGELYYRESDLIGYYMEHPNLDFPEETFRKLSPNNQEFLQKSIEELRTIHEATSGWIDESMVDLDEDGELEEMTAEEIKQAEQEEMNELIREFEKAYNNAFYMKYGYVPSKGGILPLITSMFLHGGIMHLLGNMLFLWLSGCNIEDVWGRILYPVFYVIGGVAAALIHGLVHSDSSIPAFGASGAIAAIMGAFLIRMAATKIHFLYLIWYGFAVWRGRFSSPAYIMLPLWLLQQLWGAFLSGGSSGVGFFAHIGGFVFGVAIAVLIKVTEFEETYITPVLEKKMAVLDEHVAAGMTKLQEDDVEGAIRELREAAKNNPDDPIVHSELSRAYFKKGKKDFALREFKRAVHIYMKLDRMAEAIDEYLDITSELPDMMLDPPQQMKIAAAIEKRAADIRTQITDEKEAAEEEREVFFHAALAYKRLISHHQNVKKSLDSPQAIKALARYADICFQRLEQPQDAYKAYKLALQSSHLSPQQKQDFQTKAEQAMKAAADQAKKEEEAKQKELLREKQRKEMAKQIAQAGRLGRDVTSTSVQETQKAKPDIPIQKRIKLVQETDAPAKYQVGIVAPIVANKVSPVPGGIDLNRPADKPVLFSDIYVICVAQIQVITQRVKQVKKRSGGRKKADYVKYDEKQEEVVVDLFIRGKSRPYRIGTDRIVYPEFFPNPLQAVLDNFRQFILYLISNIDSVYLDQGTLNFLKTGKPRFFSDQQALQLHEKIFWKQLIGAVRFQCENCWEVYWVDGNKIPEDGVRTECSKCGKPVFVQKIKSEDEIPKQEVESETESEPERGLQIKRKAEPPKKEIESEPEPGGMERLRIKNVELMMPDGWEAGEVKSQAGVTKISMGNRKTKGYLTVLSNLKSSYESSGVDYWKFSKIARAGMRKAREDYTELSGPIDVSINGMTGVQYEMTFTQGGALNKFLHTTLDGKKFFHQIIAFAPESMYNFHKPTFEKILNTFFEHEGSVR